MRSTWIGAVAALCIALPAGAQVKYTVDSKSSLAWWQIDPNMAHLWATTCPQEPSWRPGEGRSAGWFIDRAVAWKRGYAAVSDTTEVPLYPRFRVRPLCTDGAVKGEFTVADTVNWTGISGLVIVDPKYLISGEDMRDGYARDALFEIKKYEDMRYQLDSVASMTRLGDTVKADGYGSMTIRGLTKPVKFSLVVTREPNGGLRVRSKTHILPDQLISDYGFNPYAFGLGVGERIWKFVFFGGDVVMRPAAGH